jgi:hypothetical protein
MERIMEELLDHLMELLENNGGVIRPFNGVIRE